MSIECWKCGAELTNEGSPCSFCANEARKAAIRANTAAKRADPRQNYTRIEHEGDQTFTVLLLNGMGEHLEHATTHAGMQSAEALGAAMLKSRAEGQNQNVTPR